MCVDRDQIIDVVFAGYATKVESLVGHISGELENPNLGPLPYDCARGQHGARTSSGYKRGSDGIRVVPATTGANAQAAHPMQYEILTPTSTDFNVDRAFSIVTQRLREARRQGDAEGRRRHDRHLRARDRRLQRAREQAVHRLRHRHVGLGRVHRPRLHALRRDEGPVVLVERHGREQSGLRQALRPAGHHGRSGQAQGDRLRDAEDHLRQLLLHPARRTSSRSTPTRRTGRASTRS